MIAKRLTVALALTVSALSLAACGGDGSQASTAAAAATTGTASTTSTSSQPATGTSAASKPATSTSTPSKTSSSSAATTTTTTTTASAPATTTAATPKVTKSIKQWGVSCSEGVDETSQLAAAITAAGNNAFVLQIDCPVRFHTGAAISKSITVPDDVNVTFSGSGELLTVSGGATALVIAHPQQVNFTDWSLTYL